jgi:hypothetical protein
MKNIKFKIIRYSDHKLGETPAKIVGFNLVHVDDESISAYHETVLTGSQFIGKTAEECIDKAFSTLSSSMAITVNKLLTEQSVIGSYYIPN